jgi:hypothetical protein
MQVFFETFLQAYNYIQSLLYRLSYSFFFNKSAIYCQMQFMQRTSPTSFSSLPHDPFYLLMIETELIANRIILQGVVLRGPSNHISISSLGPLFKYTLQSLTFNDTDSVFILQENRLCPLPPCITQFNSRTWLAGYQPFANPDIGLAESIFRNTLLHFYCALLIKYIL